MKVALLGYGVEGEASYRYFLEKGADITIVDEAESPKAELPPGVPTILGADALSSLKDFDVVVRTPPINPRKIITDGVVTSATKEFFNVCPASIIGVTGSKGKGTTCSLIFEILKAAGKRVYLVGNIGNPALDALKDIQADDLIVFELSSFQLWDMDVSPHVAVALMIEPDHLDVHESMDDYVDAKANIRRHQTTDDICYYHPTNELSGRVAASAEPSTTAYRYGIEEDGAVYVEDGYFCRQGERLCPLEALRLPGQHNVDNACAAISAAMVYTQDHAAIEQGLRAFTGLPHRLKRVRTVHDVTFYDDSIATTPGSAIAAINAFTEPKVLILGGSDKGADYGPLAQAVANSTSVRSVVAIGSNRQRIIDALLAAGADSLVHVSDGSGMQEIVRTAASLAQPGDVVILSPAAASFDSFKNYADRGEQFVAAVEAL